MLELDAASSPEPQLGRGAVKPDDLRWPVHRGLLLFLVTLTALDLVWMVLSDLDLALWQAAGRFAIIGAMLLGAGYYGLSGRSLRISATLLAVAELLWITLAGTMLSYLAIRAGFPFVDSDLAAWDAALGFDWPAYHAVITGHLWIQLTTELLYPTSILQIAVVALTLGFSGRLAELLEFTGGLTIAAVAAVVIGAMLPALGAFHHFNVPDGGIFPFVPAIIGAHSGALQVLDLTQAEGLVFFPSYHTAISIGIVVACWPLKYLRYPALVANAALLAGVPVWGSHYLIDVIGGAVVMAIILLGWRRFVGR